MEFRLVPLERRAAAEGSFSSFLQSAFWGEFKSAYGWKPLRFALESSGGRIRLLVLVRRLPARLSFAYVPHGPDLEMPDTDKSDFLARLSEALRPFLPRSCLFIRFDPPWPEIDMTRPSIGKPLYRAAADVQPPDTVLVDLGPDEEAILAAMKPKWRYNIRLAGKKGVVVEPTGPESIPEFYELYRATSLRDRIALHPEEYYRRLFELAAEGSSGEGGEEVPDIRLWIARYEGQALAAIVTLFYGGKAVYLYGASSDEHRDLMPAYALQWAAMRAAKASACLQYDLFGIPPGDDPEHPMAGLRRFKTGFGGDIVHRPGSWDYPLIRFAYACFRRAEGARAWWFKDFKKRFRGSERAAS